MSNQKKEFKNEIVIIDYISNHKEAFSLCTDFTQHRCITKASTGLGLTSAMLTVDFNLILVTSNVSAILDKSNKEVKKDKVKTKDGTYLIDKLDITKPLKLYIHGGSKDKWNDAFNYLDNGIKVIISTTFDQIAIVKETHNFYYNKYVTNTSAIIDEFQVFGEAASYREKASVAYDNIFNDWKVPFHISTATPAYKYLDIIPSFRDKFTYHNIVRENQEKPTVEIYSYLQFNSEFNKNFGTKEKLAIFTNNSKIYKSIIPYDRYGSITQELTGNGLSTKNSLTKGKTKKQYDMIVNGELDKDKLIYLFSSAYSNGFDLNERTHMMIMVDATIETDKKYLNEIVQIIGRSRVKPLSVKLFYRGFREEVELEYDPFIYAQYKINNIPYLEGNYILEAQSFLNMIGQHQTYPLEKLVNGLNGYGFNINTEKMDEMGEITANRISFAEKTHQIKNQDLSVTRDQLKGLFDNIKGDSDNIGISYKDLMPYVYGYVSHITGTKFLGASPRDYDIALNRIKIFFDVNDAGLNGEDDMVALKNNLFPWETLYSKSVYDSADLNYRGGRVTYKSLHCLINGDAVFLACKQVIEALYCIREVENKNLLSDDVKNLMEALEIVSKTYESKFVRAISIEYNKTPEEMLKIIERNDEDEMKKYILTAEIKRGFTKNLTRDLNLALKHIVFTYENSEIMLAQINKAISSKLKSYKEMKTGIYSIIKANRNDREIQFKNHRYMILYHLSSSIAGHVGNFKTTTVDDREYNIVTKVTRQLRDLTPYKMTTADIKSAFATFVDDMVGSSIKNEVYVNLSKGYKIPRDEAKVLYNRTLNDFRATPLAIKKVLSVAGYNEEQVEKLIDIIRTDRGSFFRSMTPLEKQAINTFVWENKIRKYTRIHDAVVFYADPTKEYVTKFAKIEFEIKTM